MSYGADVADVCRRAAGYIGRILKREKPADLLVQALTKYELASTSNGTKVPQRYSAPRRNPGTGLANSWQVVQKP